FSYSDVNACLTQGRLDSASVKFYHPDKTSLSLWERGRGEGKCVAPTLRNLSTHQPYLNVKIPLPCKVRRTLTSATKNKSSPPRRVWDPPKSSRHAPRRLRVPDKVPAPRLSSA